MNINFLFCLIFFISYFWLCAFNGNEDCIHTYFSYFFKYLCLVCIISYNRPHFIFYILKPIQFYLLIQFSSACCCSCFYVSSFLLLFFCNALLSAVSQFQWKIPIISARVMIFFDAASRIKRCLYLLYNICIYFCQTVNGLKFRINWIELSNTCCVCYFHCDRIELVVCRQARARDHAHFCHGTSKNFSRVRLSVSALIILRLLLSISFHTSYIIGHSTWFAVNNTFNAFIQLQLMYFIFICLIALFLHSIIQITSSN